jgi:signal transduction histidine kinase
MGALALTWLLRAHLDRGIMALFFAAVMVSAWYGGLGPGLLSTLLSVSTGEFFFMPPVFSFAIHSADDIAQLLVFSAVSLLVSVLSNAQQKAEGALLRSHQRLETGVRDRTAWLDLLCDMARASNEAEALGQMFRFATERICRDGIWSSCYVFLPDKGDSDALAVSESCGDPEGAVGSLSRPPEPRARLSRGQGLPGRVYESGRIEWVADLSAAGQDPGAGAHLGAHMRSALAFPVKVGQETAAVFLCFSKREFRGTPDVLHYLSVIGLELGRAIERRRLQEEYAEAVWQEQQRIAHELHDGLGQELTGLRYMATGLSETLQGEDSRSAARLATGIGRALDQIRGLAEGVLPLELDAEGLMSALARLAEKTQSTYRLSCRFECSQAVLVEDSETALQLYRIAQEAVTNAVKHGQPRRIAIRLESVPGETILEVRDDGKGLADPPVARGGSGLRIMRYRAAVIGATIRISGEAGGGTRVTCSLPAPLPPGLASKEPGAAASQGRPFIPESGDPSR